MVRNTLYKEQSFKVDQTLHMLQFALKIILVACY